jgi:hypothetical protein
VTAVKRFAPIMLLASLLASGSALAARPDPPDGTLIVKNGYAKIFISGKGALIGHFDSGYVQIRDPNPDDGTGPIVNGAEQTRDINAKTTRYSGNDIRFRMIGGTFVITIVARNLDLSVVGKGPVTIAGLGTKDDGSYTVNDGAPQDVPFPVPDVFQLAGAQTRTGGGGAGTQGG